MYYCNQACNFIQKCEPSKMILEWIQAQILLIDQISYLSLRSSTFLVRKSSTRFERSSACCSWALDRAWVKSETEKLKDIIISIFDLTGTSVRQIINWKYIFINFVFDMKSRQNIFAL